MPQITKIRVVNCFYNDRGRMIPDELFDLEDPEKGVALNTIMNLANGGGKTVLVQFFMQPVNPLARAGGRKIQDCFKRPSDHGYVVLEWKLDGAGDVRLMTGISMAGSQSADENGQAGLRYYTFCAQYELGKYSPYSIADLNLSENAGGRFVAAEYEYVRKLSKTSSGRLTCYSAEEKAGWKKCLQDYGISQDEWKNVIAVLNEDEGGLNKYFEKARTSDALIRKFILPAVENHEDMKQSAADASLEKVLLHYARRRAENAAALTEQKTNEDLLDSLSGLQENATNVIDSVKVLEDAQAKTFALRAALKAEAASLEDIRAELAEKMQACQRTLSRIDYEGKSAAYYPAKEMFDAVGKAAEEKAAEKKVAEENAAGLRHEQDILSFARLREDLSSLEGQIRGRTDSIRQKEEQSDEAGKLRDLRVQLTNAAGTERENLKKQLSGLTNEKTAAEEELSVLKNRLETGEKDLNRLQKDRDQKEGTWQARKSANDETADRNGYALMRRLDGSYAPEELNAQEKSLSDSKAAAEKEAEGIRRQLEEMEKDLRTCRENIESLTGEYSSAEAEKTGLEKNLAAYEEAVKKMLTIAAGYEQGKKALFDGSLAAAVASCREKENAALSDLSIRLKDNNKRLAAAERGSLHVPEEVEDFIRAAGVSCQTGESYILGLSESGQLRPEQVEDLLNRHPELAYSILFKTEKDRSALLSVVGEEWLQEAVPLFTMDEVDALLRGGEKSAAFLAEYDAAYFRDRENYKEALQNNAESLLTQQKRHEQALKEAEADYDALTRFPYDGNWEAETTDRLSKVQEKLDDLAGRLSGEKEGEKKMLSARSILSAGLEQKQQDISAAARAVSDFQTFREGLAAEEEAYSLWTDLDNKCRDLSNTLSAVRKELDAKTAVLEGIRSRLKMQQARAEHVQRILDEVSDASGEQTPAGTMQDRQENASAIDLDSCYKEYQALSDSLGRDISELKKQLERLQEQKEQAEKQQQLLSVEPAEAEGVYWSPEREADLKQKERDAEKLSRHLMEEFTILQKKAGRAESDFEKAKADLAPYDGLPLPPTEISGDFACRRKREKDSLKTLEQEDRRAEQKKEVADSIYNEMLPVCEKSPVPEALPQLSLEEQPRAQWSRIRSELDESERKRDRAVSDLAGGLADTLHRFEADALPEIVSSLRGLKQIVERQGESESRFGTVQKGLGMIADTLQKRNSQIATDLADLDNARTDIINQCLLRGKTLYKALVRIQASSRVKIQEGRSAVRMIRFAVPEEKEGVSENAARAAISAEIDRGAAELAADFAAEGQADAPSEKDLLKKAGYSVGSEKLLHLYTGRDSIEVKVFKVDRDSSNSGYRTWEDSLVQNSGAEKFVVFFAVILSIMAYTRSEEVLGTMKTSGVLLMDNPFGSITSGHLLKPVFEIARHFNVQLICLTDIDKADIVECFDNTIRLRIVSQAASDLEVLTHEGNERIEHGYYKVMYRQTSLF